MKYKSLAVVIFVGLVLSSIFLAQIHGVIAASVSSLSITTTSCPDGTQYVAYAGCTLIATGGTAPYAFSWNETNGSYAALPEGLKLNASTGAITGTVYGQGTYVVQLIATDAAGATSTKNISFAIAGDSTLGGCSLFLSDSIFHTNISGLPVDTSPAAAIPSVYQGATIKPFFGSASGGAPNGVPFIRVPWNQSLSTVATTLYQSYFTSGPFPSYAPPEGTSNSNGDRHVLVLQTAGGGNPCKLWEMWQGINEGNSAWTDSSNAYWPDLSSYALTPLDTPAATFYGTTDAAGLPVAPLLVNYDEVASGVVTHPIRFTLNHMEHNYVWPATDGDAGVGSCAGVPLGSELSQSSPPSTCTFSGPAGEIYRLKASVVTPSACSNDPQSLVIVQAFRDYGIILADNGISGGLIGTPDSRWSDSQLSCLTNLTLSDFEPVNVSSIMVNSDSAATIYSASTSTLPISSSSVPPAVVAPIGISSTSTPASVETLILNIRSLVIQLLTLSDGGKPLTIGSAGTDVWALQAFLSIDGAGPASTKLASVGSTGDFGPITASALAEYQKSVGVTPASGYFGPITSAYITSHP
jgi:hypothetical protein